MGHLTKCQLGMHIFKWEVIFKFPGLGGVDEQKDHMLAKALGVLRLLARIVHNGIVKIWEALFRPS